MNRLAITVAALAVVCSAAPAQAAKDIDPRLDSTLACASVAEDTARLRCFDQAVVTLRQAVEAGTLVAKKDAIGDPSGMAGVIRASAQRGYNRFWVQLDNGDKWEVHADSAQDQLPRRGAKVTFKKAPLGGYWFDEPGYRARKASVLGRSAS